MARKQLGTGYLLFLDVSLTPTPDWKIVLCQTTATINTPIATTDARSKCGPDTLVDIDTETIECEGQLLQKDVTDTLRMDIIALRTLVRTKTRADESIKFKLAPSTATVEDEGKIIYSGEAKFTNISDTFPDNELATVSLSMNAIGEIVETEYVHPT